MQARRADDDGMNPNAEATKDYAFFHSPKFKICFLSMWCVGSMKIMNSRWCTYSWCCADAFGISFNVVLFALDQFIITVVVPQIVSEFDALDKGGSR